MAVFLARMVIPRSRSRSLESMTRSVSSWLARKTPLWRSMASTRVVLPWSTCAMIATLRSAVVSGGLLKNHRSYQTPVVLDGVDPGHAAWTALHVHDPLRVGGQHGARAFRRRGGAHRGPRAAGEPAGMAPPPSEARHRDPGAGPERFDHAVHGRVLDQ